MNKPYSIAVPSVWCQTVKSNGRVIPESVPAKIAASALSLTKHRIEIDEVCNSIRVVDVCTEKILDLISKCREVDQFLKMLSDRALDRVVMGPAVYRSAVRGTLEIQHECYVETRYLYRGVGEVAGFVVQMIPWFRDDGILLIPTMNSRWDEKKSSPDIEQMKQQIDGLLDENRRLKNEFKKKILLDSGIKEIPGVDLCN